MHAIASHFTGNFWLKFKSVYKIFAKHFHFFSCFCTHIPTQRFADFPIRQTDSAAIMTLNNLITIYGCRVCNHLAVSSFKQNFTFFSSKTNWAVIHIIGIRTTLQITAGGCPDFALFVFRYHMVAAKDFGQLIGIGINIAKSDMSSSCQS